jgi:hypothetical protein
MSLERRAAILAAILGVTMPNGCVVVDDPQHCANRDGDKTCAELYAAGVRCSTCERFYNGCVDDEPEPGCGVDDDEASESSEDDGSSTDRAELECEDCPDDAGALEAVR